MDEGLPLAVLRLHVAPQRVHVAEAAVAAAAAVRPLLRVVLHVVLERRAEHEALPADGAAVGSLTRVRPHVDLHVRAGGEGLEADAAAVGLLAGVRSQVADHGRGDVEALAADVAAVRLLARVRPHVDLHVALAAEAFPADAAAKRLLARVRPRVHLQLHTPPERLATEFADVDLQVRLQVLQQGWLVGLRLTAHAAETAFIVCVDLGVVPQGATVAERHPAHSAGDAAAAAGVLALGVARLRGRGLGGLAGGAGLGVVFLQLHLQLHSVFGVRVLLLTLEVFGFFQRSFVLELHPRSLIIFLLVLNDGRLRLLEVVAMETWSICRRQQESV